MQSKFSFLVLLLSIAFTLIIISCGKDSGTVVEPTPVTPVVPEESTVDLTTVRSDVANNLATALIIPAYENLKKEVDKLVISVENFNDNPNETSLDLAQVALRNSWIAWQSSAIYMFGPAEEVALRKSLNTYPTDIDQINSNVQSNDYILSSLTNQAAVGFPAIDYLLNNEQNSIVVEQFTSIEAANQRKQYLNDLVIDIQNRVNHSLNGWLSSGDNYQASFTETGALGIDVGSSLSIIVNSIDLHFQRFTRDGKIAIPAGVRSAGVPRPKAIEALYGNYSVELLTASIIAYEKLFKGVGANDVDGASLYDYLVAIDAKDLAEDITTQFETTKTTINQLADPLGDQINTDLDKLTNVFIEMQKLVVLFKADMASLMGISITNQDNDGD